jgi:large subunit ribosomal protein L23
MALFSRNKKEEKKGDAVAPTQATASGNFNSHVSHVLLAPRITEKATMATGMGIYVFDVMPTASKQQIKSAIERVYKVRPRLVRVVTIPTKNVRNMRTGQSGVQQGGKKAYVYLKKGETITIM